MRNDFSLLLLFLGSSPSDGEQFDTWLTANRVYSRPHQAVDDDEWSEKNWDAAERNARASLIDEDERLGICFIYEPLGNYERLYGKAKNKGEFVLKELVFYAPGTRGSQGYSGSIPGGVRFGMSPTQVQNLLGPHSGVREVHELNAERYLIDNTYILNVSYQENAVSIVHLRLPHCFDRQAFGLPVVSEMGLANTSYNPLELIELLGHSASNERLDKITTSLGWSGIGMGEVHEIDELIPSAGLALHYRQTSEIAGLRLKRSLRKQASTIFTGFRVNRRGDMASDGYGGALPFGLTFYDSPEQILAKVKIHPNKQDLAPDTGYYMWNLDEYILHTMFSLIDLQLYRLSIYSKVMAREFRL